MTTPAFIRQLYTEISQWVDDGIIDESQKENILQKYPFPETVKKQSSSINLPKIIISLAALLLCAGIILFYAANWKRMTPVVKLLQVFFLIIGTYGTAYYLLAVNKTYPTMGRILLIIGMVSYGVGIMLVAQIFHISAHPTNGILCLGSRCYGNVVGHE